MSRVVPPTSLFRRHAGLLLVLALLAVMLHDVLGPRGFLAMRRNQREVERLRQEIQQINEQNRQLAEQIRALKTDPKMIERIAREEMGLVRPGELIFKLPPPQPASPPASAPLR